MLCSIDGIAQSFSIWNTRAREKHTLNFGILLQYNQPWYHIIKSESFTKYDTISIVNPKNGIGASLGILLDWNINKYVQLRTNIAQFGIDYRTVEFYQRYPDFRESAMEQKTLGIQYLRWPLVLKLQSDKISNFFRVYMMGGVVWTLGVGKEGDGTIRSLRLKSDDIGVVVGIGFHLYFRTVTLSPQFKFASGFSNVLDITTPNKFNRATQELYNRSLSFSLMITP